jgi:sugar lactone lactonase YvrE
VTEIFAELHVDCRNELGEMPVWCPESGTLYWIDVVNPGRVFHWASGTPKPDFCSYRWGAGTVVRISPDGQLDRVVRLPVSQPTACCFGDRDRRTLYITTARYALDPDHLLAQPVAGGIFAIRTDVPGLELPHFQLQPVGGSLLP